MKKSFNNLVQGYQRFREKYRADKNSVLTELAQYGQSPEVMIVACSDSRVDPAVILQCDPGQLFVVRNVANIIPPYEVDDFHHGTSAALEFGICHLNVKHLIILAHSDCGGARASLDVNFKSDFIRNWVSLIAPKIIDKSISVSEHAQNALHSSYENCLTFPWIVERLNDDKLQIHRWFFDIGEGKIKTFNTEKNNFVDFTDGN